MRVAPYPLDWPSGWPRSRSYSESRFSNKSMAQGIDKVLSEIGRLRSPGRQVVISSNIELRQDGLPYSNRRRPTDPGVAVYFKVAGSPTVLACDRWNKPEDNLWAIGKHIEALRGQERWGVGSVERAFSAYAELPSADVWWSVLGFASTPASLDVCRARYRELSAKVHPDVTGDDAAFKRLAKAMDAAKEHYAK